MRNTLLALVGTLVFAASALATEISSGEIEKTEASRHLLTLSAECDCGSGKIIQMTFKLKDETKVTLDGKAAKLADLKKGDRVDVEYEDTEDVKKVTARRD